MALIKRAQQRMESPQLRVPASAIWYPLHGDTASNVPGQPTLAFSSGASGNWGAQGYRAFPSGNTSDIINSNNSTVLDDVLSMIGMQAGTQLIIAHESTTPNHSGTGFLWCYGNDGGSWSYFGLAMINTEKLQFFLRGVGASAQVSHSFTDMDALPLVGQRCVIVTSIEAQSPTTFLVRILYRIVGDAAFADTGYSALFDCEANGGTNPGRTSANHAGLTLGGRPTASWTPANRLTIGNYASLFGNGSGNGRLGNFVARKFPSYDPNRALAVALAMWSKPREFPEALL